MSLRAEKTLPILAAVVAGVAAFWSARFGGFEAADAMIGGSMAFGIIAAGFAAMERNAFIGMGGSRVMEFAIRTGYYSLVLSYFMHCVYAGGLLAILSFVGFWVDGSGIWRALWFGAFVGALALVVALTVRNAVLMDRIVRRFIEE